jgi:nicotinate-nucleotide adenylyltransferase
MRLGIFGGTFDPVHNVHLFVAESVRQFERLDRILFVPTNGHHYRERARAPIRDRCEMLRAAIASNPAFEFDDTDLRPNATGYTADLLPALMERRPDARFTFIIGADSLVNADWVRLDEVLEALECFAIVPRAGIAHEAVQRAIAAIPPALRERVHTMNLPEFLLSATQVRALLARGHSVRYLVPDAVWSYIAAHNLYDYNAQPVA